LNQADFVQNLKKGDEEAFRFLVEEKKNSIYNICLGYTRNHEDAEDLAQDVFIEVFRSIEHFKGESDLNTWIYRIAVNKSLQFLRSLRRKRRWNQMMSFLSFEDYVNDSEEIKIKERSEILLKAVESLPENQKTVFLLHQTEGLSYQEISEIMDTSLSAIESLMFRAKQNLRTRLSSWYQKWNNE
jgi:RNA polymerase sigma-70 factor (ECF subfamily)